MKEGGRKGGTEMKKWTWGLAAAASISSTAVSAQMGHGPRDCLDASISLNALWIGENGEGVRSFYNGMVTVLRLDTEEPAAASAGLAILMPSGDGSEEPIFTACHVFLYYGSIDFDGMESSYDPARGLTLTVPAYEANLETGGRGSPNPIRVLINAGAGTLSVID